MQRAIRHQASARADYVARERATYGLWARVANLVLGCWLFASAFLLPHTSASGGNTWIVGMLIVIFSLWSIWAPPIRRFNTAAGVWLLASVLLLPYASAAPRIHNLILGVLVLALSLVPSRSLPTRAYV